MSLPNYYAIDARILRLKVLLIEERENHRTRFTQREIEDLDSLLDELHRLHLAVSLQRAELDKKNPHPEKTRAPEAARTHDRKSPRPTGPGKKTRAPR